MYIDFHNDTILKIMIDGADFDNGDARLHIDIPKIRVLKELKALFFAAYIDTAYHGDEAYRETLRLLGALKEVLGRNEKYIGIALSSKEMEEADRPSAILAVEGGIAINNNLDNLKSLYDEGVRLLTLTHVRSTDWAGSANEDSDRGLSGFGEEVVRTMNDLGMIVDVAHVSEPAIFDVCRVTRYPVVSSHGSIKGAFKGFRALSDDAVRAIADTGGVVGIFFFPEALIDNPHAEPADIKKLLKKYMEIEDDESLAVKDRVLMKHNLIMHEYRIPEVIPGLEAVWNHIDYVVNLVGDDHIALGSDFDGITYSCRGLEDISKLGDLAQYMRDRGYSEKRVDKIMGANIVRVVKEILK